jgi:hypothetical protein
MLFPEGTRWQVARATYRAVIKTALMKRQVKNTKHEDNCPSTDAKIATPLRSGSAQ